MLRYVLSVKLTTTLLSSKTGVQGSFREEHARNISAWVLTSCYNTNSGCTSTKWIDPLDKIGNSGVIQDSLLHIYHCMYTNSKILTTLYAHIFSTRLWFEFILLITRTSTQQFIDHIPVYSQSNSNLTSFPSLWLWCMTENRRYCIGLQHLLQRSEPFQHATSKILYKKMFGTDPRILMIK